MLGWIVVEMKAAVGWTAVSCHLLLRPDKPPSAAHMSKELRLQHK